MAHQEVSKIVMKEVVKDAILVKDKGRA